MTIDGLTLQNFMSFTDEVTIDFRDLSGLILIAGNNKDSEGASSNGAGKSTLLEAIVWGLYGKTTRGIRYDEVVNRHVGKDCLVKVTFSDNYIQYEVVRARKHFQHSNSVFFSDITNDKTITGKDGDDTQKMINKVIGMDFETFTSTVMFGQGCRTFVDYVDSERKDLLTKVLGYDFLDALLEETKKQKKELSKAVDDRTTRLEVYKDDLKGLEAIDYTERIKAFEESRKRSLETLEVERDKELQTVEEEHQKALEASQEAQGAIEQQKGVIDTCEQALKAQREKKKEVDGLRADRDGLVSSLAGLRAQQRGLVEEAEGIDNMGEGTCPFCRQQIDKALLRKYLVGILDKVDGLKVEEDRLAALQSEIDGAIRETSQGVDSEIQKQERALREASAEVRRLESVLKFSQERVAGHQARVDGLRAQYARKIESERTAENPYVLMEQENKKKIEVQRARIGQVEASLEADRQLLGTLGLWEEAFGNKGIRSQLFDRILAILDQKTHDYMLQLSDGSISVSFDTQMELKSGKTKDKFVINVADGEGVRTFESYSGGEKQRVKLAVNLAISDISCSERERSFDFVVFDEALGHLDDDGMLRAIDMWQNQIERKEKRLILAVEHDVSCQSLFDQTIWVVKDCGASRIET